MLVNVARTYLPLPQWVGLISDLAPITIPLTAAYTVVRHQALNLGYFANRLLFLGMLATIVTLLIWTLDLLVSRHLANTRVEISIYLALALGAGSLIQTSRVRVVRAIDRVLFRQRYSAAVTLDRIRSIALFEGSVGAERVAVEIAQGLDLASLALFRRSADGGFVREAAAGWANGTAWHLLPTDELARSLHGGGRQILLARETFDDVALPTASARPSVALPLKRAGRIEGAVLIGTRTSGAPLDRDEARGIADIFTQLVPV
jgi:hypothetical protein